MCAHVHTKAHMHSWTHGHTSIHTHINSSKLRSMGNLTNEFKTLDHNSGQEPDVGVETYNCSSFERLGQKNPSSSAAEATEGDRRQRNKYLPSIPKPGIPSLVNEHCLL